MSLCPCVPLSLGKDNTVLLYYLCLFISLFLSLSLSLYHFLYIYLYWMFWCCTKNCQYKLATPLHLYVFYLYGWTARPSICMVGRPAPLSVWLDGPPLYLCMVGRPAPLYWWLLLLLYWDCVHFIMFDIRGDGKEAMVDRGREEGKVEVWRNPEEMEESNKRQEGRVCERRKGRKERRN